MFSASRAFQWCLVCVVWWLGSMSTASELVESSLDRVRDEFAEIAALQRLVQVASSADAHNDSKRAALVQLGDVFFYGNESLPSVGPNGTLALQFYEMASQMGDATGQFHVGVAFAYGFWGFPQDEAQALVHFYFASLSEHVGALMAMGHRHFLGIGTPKNCESSLRYYELAANLAMDLRDANPRKPVLYDLTQRRLKTIAETQHKKNTPSDAEIVDYYQFSSEKGDPDATINLAFLYYYGARGLAQDLPRAAKLFQKAYDLGASGAASNLGHIYANGIGVDQNNDTALRFLREASNEGSASAQNELALMYFHGNGVDKDEEKALQLFKTAAKAGSSDAFYNLGVFHMQGHGSRRNPEYEVAHGYFQVAAHQGHTLSTHKLAHMSMHGIGTAKSCKSGVEYMKMSAERGEWDRILSRAYQDYRKKNYDAAFLKYAVMAQQGYEVAQHNAAWMLDQGLTTPNPRTSGDSDAGSASANPSRMLLSMALGRHEDERLAKAAMLLYKLCASQGNVDANLKIGDFYYYGKAGQQVDFIKASAHYSLASKRQNAQAMFNLGYMYQYGIGLGQDFYLAKRFFDKARETTSDANVPVTLALWKLKLDLWMEQWGRKWREWTTLTDESEHQSNQAKEQDDQQEYEEEDENADDMPSWIAQWVQKFFSGSSLTDSAPSSTSTSASTIAASAWSQMIQADNLLILVLSLALGVVVYIRSERNLQLRRQLEMQQQQAEAQDDPNVGQ